MIEFRNVCKSYGTSKIVKNINLMIPDGQLVVLIGPSGCGKTTTLKMVNRLIEMNSGEILINGKNTASLNPEKLRSSIGYVIQQIGLFPNMTVEENICVVPRLLKWDKHRCHQRAIELLSLVNMPFDEYGKKYPNEMSGGQQQRIGVLRALAAEPPIILMDEPFGALDPITRDILQDEVRSLQKRLGKTVIFVTHDMNEALKMADIIVFMNAGEILQVGSPEELLRSPANDIVREFIGKHTSNYSDSQPSCADLMKTRVFKVHEDRKINECVALMNSREIDSLIVVDQDECFIGVLKIEVINQRGKTAKSIRELLISDTPTVTPEAPAKEAFDILIGKATDFVLVLTEDHQVAGIITRTSMSKALAALVWGDA